MTTATSDTPKGDSRRTVLVTGATRGLGLAISRRLAAEGYSVIGGARSPSDELQQLIDETSGRVHFAPLDLARFDSLHTYVRDATKAHGPLYGLVNNAAVAHGGVLATLHDSQIGQMIDVNVTGTMLLTKYVVRSMLLQGTGRIVNVASIVADTGFNGLSVYGATKAALVGFTRSLARELGRAGITANAVLPGYMETEMTSAINMDQLETIRRRSALLRLVDVGEVAGSVAFLMGPDASGITGTTLTVDAGSTA